MYCCSNISLANILFTTRSSKYIYYFNKPPRAALFGLLGHSREICPDSPHLKQPSEKKWWARQKIYREILKVKKKLGVGLESIETETSHYFKIFYCNLLFRKFVI